MRKLALIGSHAAFASLHMPSRLISFQTADDVIVQRLGIVRLLTSGSGKKFTGAKAPQYGGRC